ncbi:uncharacterized protein G2W53_037480 [Senna tora]|uniref:Uncharacterized protein n=1 Tax=Senna tora TaxID=362788 RepID=A0A834SXK3_9FABA|nr:uncharacterized protein G2W53_037480 [Senna tora]
MTNGRLRDLGDDDDREGEMRKIQAE